MKYRNPVIPGCYPDPSICAAEGKYYLVCSSFQFFPGIPLFESRDLVNWTRLGNVLDRDSQLPLRGANSTGGIYASTIRYHAGRFYVITTNVTGGGHFLVWTDDIRGAWSEPVPLGSEGIDPSLFFEDGRAYFMHNGNSADGRGCIFQCEIDPATGARLTPPQEIWYGTGGRFLEGPHLYRIGAYYYLMASEGGTEYGHTVVLARGSSPYGPFEPAPGNPVLTNRNLGGYPLQGCGHADLVQDAAGNRWAVHLAFRQTDSWVMHHVTGREVCLVPVTLQEDGWLSFGAEGTEGTSRLETETDRIPDSVTQNIRSCWRFDDTDREREWYFLQNPHRENYALSGAHFLLKGTDVPLSSEADSPTWIALRQTALSFALSVRLDLKGGQAGLSAYMAGNLHYDLLLRETAEGLLPVRRAVLGTVTQEECISLPAGTDVTDAVLMLKGTPGAYCFSVRINGQVYGFTPLETRFLSSETAGNFTGVSLALFAEDGAEADFTDFQLIADSACGQ